MKKVLTSTVAVSALMAISQTVQAHPGHDHAHWASHSIHLLTVLAVAAAVVVGIAYKKLSGKQTVTKGEKA